MRQPQEGAGAPCRGAEWPTPPNHSQNAPLGTPGVSKLAGGVANLLPGCPPACWVTPRAGAPATAAAFLAGGSTPRGLSPSPAVHPWQLLMDWPSGWIQKLSTALFLSHLGRGSWGATWKGQMGNLEGHVKCVCWPYPISHTGKAHLKRAILGQEEALRLHAVCRALRRVDLLQAVLVQALRRSLAKYSELDLEDDFFEAAEAPEIQREQPGPVGWVCPGPEGWGS